MGRMTGADAEQLRALAQLMDSAANSLRRISSGTTARLGQTPWHGRDAHTFRQVWVAESQGALQACADALTAAQRDVLRHAEEQVQASTSDRGAGHSTAAAVVAAAATASAAGAASAASLATAAAALTALLNQPATPERAAAIRAWAGQLTPEQRTAFAEAHPALVGNTDGMPSSMRNSANRKLIEDYVARLPTMTGISSEERDKQAALLNSIIAGVPRDKREALVLVFDTSQPGDVRIAVSQGDPETAKNVAIMVPGVSNDLGNFQGMYDNAYTVRTNDSDTAVVAWLGYDAPGGIQDVQASAEVRAHQGAAALQRFVGGLDLESGQNVTVLGHSYGSVVSMVAAEGGGLPAVDNIVTLGSPGSERYNSVADLRLPPGQAFYAMAADGDPIAGNNLAASGVADGAANYASLLASPALGNLPGHGWHLPSDPSFGAMRPETDAWGSASQDAHGHSQYFTEGTGSLASVQAVVTGGETHARAFQIQDAQGYARSAVYEVQEGAANAAEKATGLVKSIFD